MARQPISLVLATYLHLLDAASQNVTRGHADVTIEDLASALDCDESQIIDVTEAMQGRVLDGLRLTGWDQRQVKKEESISSEGGVKSAAQRKREQRQREREARMSRDSHEESRDVTTDKDKDKDKDIKKINKKSEIEVSSTPKTPKLSNDQPLIEKHFEKFWSAGMVKTGKKKSFEVFTRVLKSRPCDTWENFTGFLYLDVRKRLDFGQFGFASLHPATYLNGERWSDEYKFNVQPQGGNHAGRKLSLIEQSEIQSQQILADSEAEEAHRRAMASYDPALRSSLDQSARPAGDRSGAHDTEFCVLGEEDGGPN